MSRSRSRDFSPLWHFINERHAIWLRKHYRDVSNGLDDYLYDPRYDPLGPGGIPGDVSPEEARAGVLTRDPILVRFRFCNVFRELDRVTLWIRRNIREPYACHEHLWLMLAAARTINWPPTLQYLMSSNGGFPNQEEFEPETMGDELQRYREQGNKVYTGAYMIRAESDPKAEWYSWTKQQYVARIVLGRLWERRDEYQDVVDHDVNTLRSVWEMVLADDGLVGWGPFMTFQWVLELRHTRYLRDAADATSWAAIGPGSMRGLNRLHGRDVGLKLTQAQALDEMRELLELSRTEVGPHVPLLEMEDVQNCLCETDKYLRVKVNGGESKRLYVPGRGW